MLGLTPRQADMLDAIVKLPVEGVVPTYDELRIELGLKSKSGVHRLIRALVERGYLSNIKYRQRTICLAGSDPAFHLARLDDGSFWALHAAVIDEAGYRPKCAG